MGTQITRGQAERESPNLCPTRDPESGSRDPSPLSWGWIIEPSNLGPACRSPECAPQRPKDGVLRKRVAGGGEGGKPRYHRTPQTANAMGKFAGRCSVELSGQKTWPLIEGRFHLRVGGGDIAQDGEKRGGEELLLKALGLGPAEARASRPDLIPLGVRVKPCAEVFELAHPDLRAAVETILGGGVAYRRRFADNHTEGLRRNGGGRRDRQWACRVTIATLQSWASGWWTSPRQLEGRALLYPGTSSARTAGRLWGDWASG